MLPAQIGSLTSSLSVLILVPRAIHNFRQWPCTDLITTTKRRYALKLGGLSVAVLAWATCAPSASAGVIGTLFTGSSGQITVTTTSITWDADASGLPVGSWNGDVTTGTDLTFLGCTGGLGDPGCLSVREGIDINHLAPLVSGVTPFPIDGFLTFAAHPLLDFTLTGVSPGSANLNCIGLPIGGSCSVIPGSPIILTLLERGS